MADFNEEKTVVVDRDTADNSSPVAWIVLLVVVLLIAAFFVMGGMRLFTMNDDTNGTGTPTNDTSAPVEDTNPIDEVTPEPTPDSTDPGTTEPSQSPETVQ